MVINFSVTSGGTDYLIDTALSTSSNDVWNGALLYVYAGTNAGCIRTVSDYVGADDKLVVTTPFPAACDTTTKYIMLGDGSEATSVINVGSTGIVLKDKDSIDANASNKDNAADVGPLVCVGASKIADHMLDVMIMRSKHIFG